MAPMGAFQIAQVADVAAAARELPNGGGQQREPMKQLNGQRQQWNGNNNGGKKRKFFENGRGGGNGIRCDDRRDDRFADRQIHQHSAIEYGRGGREHQGAMALVMDDSAKEGIRRSDPRPQVFVVGTSDVEFETGAKTIHKYDHEPKVHEARTSVDKAGDKVAASVHADARDMLPNNVIFAMPQSTSGTRILRVQAPAEEGGRGVRLYVRR